MTAATDHHVRQSRRWLAGVPFGRLVRIHLRIWWAQRALTVGAAVTCLLGLVGAVVAVATLSGSVSEGTAGQRLDYSAQFSVLVWLGLGVFAGSAPFRSRWAVLVLTVAPRRMWWLGACYASALIWALAVTAGFAALTWIGVVITLAGNGWLVAAGSGLGGWLGQVLLGVLVNVTVGFFLGAAIRASAVTLVAVYVVIPTALAGAGEAGQWFDFTAAWGAVSHLAVTPSSVAPVVFALLLWIVGPAALAAARLRRAVAQ
ncbi:hypothetical protein [Kutzneria sp. NPDC052558]|uniref:hypothetical protein n=1 Tax=Kutzneria sp. NPDC052558 TaxID=3364121 RepID=UPI0037C90035